MKRVDRRRMCPHCRAFISQDDKVCPYCHEKLASSLGLMPDRESARSSGPGALASLVPEHSTMTMLFLLVNVAFWIAAVVISANQGNGNAILNLDNRTLILLGAKWRPEITFGGQWWRLVTAGFLHGGVAHIFMNGMSLFYLGTHLEEYLGAARFLIVYLVSTVCGFYLSLIVNPMAPSVGASAALMGFVGALFASSRFPGSPTAPGRKTYYYWMVGLLVLGFVGNLASMTRTDNAAHIGGLIGGYLVTVLTGLPGPLRSKRELILRTISVMSVAITLFCFGRMYLYFAALSYTPAYR